MLPLQIGEGEELRPPLQLDRAGLAVAVFGDDALGNILVLRVGVIIFVTVEEQDGVGVLLDGAGLRRSESIGRLSVLDSLARESWLRQMTGTFSSLAMILSAREISLTIVTRLSPDLPGAAAVMSCR